MTFIYDDEFKCVLCGNSVCDENLCAECRRKLKNIKENPVIYKDTFNIYSAIYYNSTAKELLLKFKYMKDFQCGEVIAELMIDCIKENSIEFDYIIPVPIKEDSYKKRRFNQSLFLAKSIGEYFDKKVLDVMFFNKKIQDQKTLNRYDREKNIKGSLSIKLKDNELKYKKILIVDDVITTGSTLKECIEVIGMDKNIDIKVLTGIKSSI